MLDRLLEVLKAHQRLDNRVLIRAQLLILRDPKPGERLTMPELCRLWGLQPANTRKSISHMVKVGVLEVEAFKGITSGWRILRIGPPPERPRRPQPIVTDCDSGTPDPPAD